MQKLLHSFTFSFIFLTSSVTKVTYVAKPWNFLDTASQWLQKSGCGIVFRETPIEIFIIFVKVEILILRYNRLPQANDHNYFLNTTAQTVQPTYNQRSANDTTNVQPTMQSQNEIFPSFACDL